MKDKFPQSSVNPQTKQVTEEVTVDDGKIFVIGDMCVAISVGGQILPSLVNEELLKTLPSILVDMGAIPHICNGADIMRPGIREVRGDFEKGMVVVVRDIKFGKPIAVSIAEASSEALSTMSKGRAAQNVHYVGDRFWEGMKKS